MVRPPARLPFRSLLEKGLVAARAWQELWQTGGEVPQALGLALQKILAAPVPVATLGGPGVRLPLLDAAGQQVGARIVEVDGPVVENGELHVHCRYKPEDPSRTWLGVLLRLPVADGEVPLSPEPAAFTVEGDDGEFAATIRFPLTGLTEELQAFSWVVAREHVELFLQSD